MENQTSEPKKKGGRPKGSKSGYTMTPAAKAVRDITKGYDASDENRIILQHNMEILSLPEIKDYEDSEAIKTRINEYLNICLKNSYRPTVAGLALALGVNRSTLWKWATGARRDGSETQKVIQQVYRFLNAEYEDSGIMAKGNPVFWIFLLRNHFGYQDSRDIVVSTPDQGDTAKSADDLLAAAALLPDDVIDSVQEEPSDGK